MNASPASSGPAPSWCLWRNPVLRRYFRTRLRPRALGASLIITLLIAGFIFAMCRTFGLRQIELMEHQSMKYEGAGVMIPAMADVERYCLIPLLVFQGFILFLLGTGQVAGGMTAEADEGTMDYVRLSPMTPLSKVLGYLFGLPIREWVMFAATLPFTAWGLWRGEVPASAWVPVYSVVLSAAILYHLTGLTAGTVMRNRRWAFLASMGSVFLLYTVVPQLAKFGLVYLEYLTITPVVTECISGFMQSSGGALVKAAQSQVPDVRFFNLGFPEAVFTIFSQQVLCLTFVIMLWRRWRRTESHLMSKAWATGFSAWIQIVLLGCSIPLISSGMLFVSRRIGMALRFRDWDTRHWTPSMTEAITMISVYGTVTLLTVILLTTLIAPGRETRARGGRRAARLGLPRVPVFSDEAPALPFVLVMCLAGAAGWAFFASRIVGSHWFPGQEVPWWTPLIFFLTLATAGTCKVLLYESRGIKGVFLGVVFVGVVPLLAGAVMGMASRDLSTAAVWVTAASPFVAPANAVAAVMPDALGNQDAIRLAGPRAFAFWQGIMAIAAIRLYLTRNRKADAPVMPPPPPAPQPAQGG